MTWIHLYGYMMHCPLCCEGAPLYSCLSAARCSHMGDKALTPGPDILLTDDLWPVIKEGCLPEQRFPCCLTAGRRFWQDIGRDNEGTDWDTPGISTPPPGKQHFLSLHGYVGKPPYLSYPNSYLLITTQGPLTDRAFNHSPWSSPADGVCPLVRDGLVGGCEWLLSSSILRSCFEGSVQR